MLPTLPLPLPQQRDVPPPEPSPALSADESSTTGSSAPPDTPSMGTGLAELDTNPLEDQSLLSNTGQQGILKRSGVVEGEGTSGAEGDEGVYGASNPREFISTNRDAAPIANKQAIPNTSISTAIYQDGNTAGFEAKRQTSHLPHPSETYVISTIGSLSPTCR